MPLQKAEAAWRGTFRDGEGKMKLGSGAFEGAFTYRTRMEDEPGTNPEELLGAAHAGCFSMSLARRLEADGYPPERVHTEARVRFGRSGEGYAISRIDLRTEVEAHGVDEELFLEKAEAAKRDCAVSKALTGVEENHPRSQIGRTRGVRTRTAGAFVGNASPVSGVRFSKQTLHEDLR